MKRFLRWFLGFLERKFPDKVVLTPEQMRELVKKQSQTNFMMQSLVSEHGVLGSRMAAVEEGGGEKVKSLETKMAELQADVNKLNFAMGFVPPTMKNAAKVPLER